MSAEMKDGDVPAAEPSVDLNAAADKPADAPDARSETQTPPAPEDKQQEKTFSQSELDKIVQERIQRERGKLPAKEELEAFKKWQDDQKTAEQLYADRLTEAQRTASEAQSELVKYKQLDAIRKANVDESFLGYVNYEVSDMARQKDIPFEEALLLFMKNEGQKYARQEKPAEPETRDVIVDIGARGKEQPKPDMSMQFTGVRPRK